MSIINDAGKLITNITENDKKVSRELILQAVKRTLTKSKLTMCLSDISAIADNIEKDLYQDITAGDYQGIFAINHQNDDDFKMNVTKVINRTLFANTHICPLSVGEFICRYVVSDAKCTENEHFAKDAATLFGEKELSQYDKDYLNSCDNNYLFVHLYTVHRDERTDVGRIIRSLLPPSPIKSAKPKLHIVWKSVLLTLISFIVMSIVFKLINSNNSWLLSIMMSIAETLVITCVLAPMKYFWFEKPSKPAHDKLFME